MARPVRPERSGEPESIGSLLGRLQGEGTLEAGMRLGRLGRAWPAVVGERLAKECMPAALQHRTLIVKATSAAWAVQLRFLSTEICARANEALGGSHVRDVRVVVEPP